MTEEHLDPKVVPMSRTVRYKENGRQLYVNVIEDDEPGCYIMVIDGDGKSHGIWLNEKNLESLKKVLTPD